MKVKEVIEKLKTYPDDLAVLVDGYEGGFGEISVIKKTKVKLDVHEEDYYGAHDEVEGADTEVIVIKR